MSKALLSAVLSFFFLSMQSQDLLPDNFKIGNFLELYSQDSLRMYFSSDGSLTDKKCANYYREGKMDSVLNNVTGDFYDYYTNGNVFFKATMLKNNLEGKGVYYFNNGKISEEGNFKNNERIGRWSYYYPNGKVKKVYYFEGEEPQVLEAYKINGKPLVINGNGKFQTEFNNSRKGTGFETSGMLLNGKKHGDWTFSNYKAMKPISIETYENGNFVKGVSNSKVYTENPKIKLTGYSPGENLNLIFNYLNCPEGGTVISLTYDDLPLYRSFYPKLQESISNQVGSINNQWLIVGIQLSKDSQIKNLDIASSINDLTIERILYDEIQKMTKWKSTIINGKSIESDIYFSVLVENSEIFVLPYYFYKK